LSIIVRGLLMLPTSAKLRLWTTLSAFVTIWCGGIADAQTVDFSNTRAFTTPGDRKVYNIDGAPLVGTDFVAQLYYGVNAGSLTPLTTAPVTFRNVPTTDPFAGTWIGGTRLLTGMTVGDVAILQVRAWDATGGLSLDEARLLGRAWGQSATFTYQIDAFGPDFYMEEFRAFTLVPEPSVIVLGVVGSFALFVLQRRHAMRR